MESVAIAPQRSLSKYKLLEEIGHGGMATVYRARDTRLERDVALKLIHRHLRESSEIEARFNSEAKAIAKLRHPNIVEVYDVSEADQEDLYLIVELVRGQTLRELLKERGPAPVEFAAEVVLELGAALEHAHEQGVIHRDIKPENVLLEMPTGRGRGSVDDLDRARVKLTDFGIAKLLDAQGVTSTGQVLGSPAHMAPEQIEGRRADVRADVFSLGVLFYEAVVGELPFAGNNPAQVLRNVLDGTFQPAHRLKPEVGERWSAIIGRALERESSKRFQTITEFINAIRDELTLLGFEEPRRDIADYLQDPEQYSSEFVPRLVEGLKKAGTKAREERDVAGAASLWCRALVYQPADPNLLDLVRRLRRRRHYRRGAALGVAASILAVCAVVVVLAWPKPEPPGLQGGVLPSAGATADLLSVPSTQPPAGIQAEVPKPQPTVASPRRRSRPRTRGRRARALASAASQKESTEQPQTRSVSIRVTGAVGGNVRIDGRERPWFGGVTHELSLGFHQFEFVPPNETCCVATQRRVEVVAGDGVQLVIGRIPFKKGGLAVTDPNSRGWRLSCPTLFSRSLMLPGRRAVAMSRVRAEGTCMLSNPAEGSATRRKVVTLQAGSTTVLPWP